MNNNNDIILYYSFIYWNIEEIMFYKTDEKIFNKIMKKDILKMAKKIYILKNYFKMKFIYA